ncbi:MAG: hypothetical protein IH586_21115 [Anaerolineaceae bacterium]|nr:hypothetical protein [Anaerolineaceae bacterium]
MSQHPVVRRGLLACTMLFLSWLAWQALLGGFRQLPRSRTVGQKVETVAQFECGFLSLLVMLTCFRLRRWAQPVRTLWSIALGTAAGLSSLVWGPPMPFIGILFVAIALLISRAINWALRTALAGDLHTIENIDSNISRTPVIVVLNRGT